MNVIVRESQLVETQRPVRANSGSTCAAQKRGRGSAIDSPDLDCIGADAAMPSLERRTRDGAKGVVIVL